VTYDLIAYSKMLADSVRVRAYADALRESVRKDSVVLDIGTGPGIFALLACRAGAARVYAVEPDPIIGLARTLAKANGCGDRITFIEGSSRTIDLPERADVVVADIRGQLPLRADAIAVLIDARDRHMRQGGTLIPASDTICGAVVEAPRTYGTAIAGWDGTSLGLDFSSARDVATHALWRMASDDGRLLSGPARWAELDYRVIQSPSVRAPLEWEISEAGISHGVMLWFDARLSANVVLSTGPVGPPLVYGRVLLPWPMPVPCERGTRVDVALRADFVNDDYIWTWETKIAPRDRAPFHFRESTLTSALLSKAQLKGAE
jgi:type I protein arginine methyltransferase